jgi:hypothetical protein
MRTLRFIGHAMDKDNQQQREEQPWTENASA